MNLYLLPSLQHINVLVAGWGLSRGAKRAFRPAMSLASGELSGIDGPFLMMTATATSTTIRLLQSQLPEIRNWKNILLSPLRKNVTFIVPPPEILPSNIEALLAPFLKDMKLNNTTYLIIVRGKDIIYTSRHKGVSILYFLISSTSIHK